MGKLLHLLVLVITVASCVHASDSPPYRSHSRLDVIDDYHQQLKDDTYQLEHKAIELSKKECLAGEESFNICDPEKLHIIEFILCLMKPYTTYAYDPLRRPVGFPKDAFKQPPAVLVGIRGVGSFLFGQVKVESDEVTSKSFDIVVTGGYPSYPYSVTVQWIACPRKYPISPTVRDFVIPTYPPADPYYPPNRDHQDTYPFPLSPYDPHRPADPYRPTDPHQPANTYPPNDPYPPTSSHNPTNPYSPTNPYVPTDTYQPTDPYVPTDPYEPMSPPPDDPYTPTGPYPPY